MKKLVIIVLICSLGCSEIKTESPDKAYRLWSGDRAPETVKLINGQYWESAHFFREYILYLELNVNPEWKDQFIETNELVRATKRELKLPSDAPIWFKPTDDFVIFEHSRSNQGSAYFFDEYTDHVFIYEIQL